MKTGMLWFDDDTKRTLAERIERAALRFKQKYGSYPDLCYSNPNTQGVDGGGTVYWAHDQPIQVKCARSILPNHFWLGIAE